MSKGSSGTDAIPTPVAAINHASQVFARPPAITAPTTNPAASPAMKGKLTRPLWALKYPAAPLRANWP